MTKRMVDIGREQAWLDIASHGRKAPGRRGHGRPDMPAASARGGVPEVMVKVTGGGKSIQQVKDEIAYFGRRGELEIETDDGLRLTGEGLPRKLIEDWDLELERLRGKSPYSGKSGRPAPKMVYNLMFSMPPGTSPQMVLTAVRKFAVEKFALKHRYGMVLHTDADHPHVHMLVKARSEEGERMHITKPMLREWRQSFAQYLRDMGVAAKATDRSSRAQPIRREKETLYHIRLGDEAVGRGTREGGNSAGMLSGRGNVLSRPAIVQHERQR